MDDQTRPTEIQESPAGDSPPDLLSETGQDNGKQPSKDIPSVGEIFLGSQQPRRSEADSLITMPNNISEWGPRTIISEEERVNLVDMVAEDEMYDTGENDWRRIFFIDRTLRLSQDGGARRQFLQAITNTKGIMQGVRNRLGGFFNKVVEPEETR